MKDGLIKLKVIFSQTEDEALSDIIEESEEITGTLIIELSKGKVIFTPDTFQNNPNGIYSNVIIDNCSYIEVNLEEEKVMLCNEDGKWLFDVKE